MTLQRIPIDKAEKIRRPYGRVYFYPLAEGLPALSIFEPIIDLFDLKRGSALVPRKDAFDFKDLRGWHARFCLTCFNDDYSDGEVRIMGEDYGMLLGGALRQGMRISETVHPKLPQLEQYFRTLLTRPAAGYFTGALPEVGREHVSADILDLPATDAAGKSRYILSFIRERKTVV